MRCGQIARPDDEISPTVGLSALLAIFGRQTKAFEPTIPKGAV